MFNLKRLVASLVIVLLLAPVIAAPAWAKGDPVEAMIDGPGLDQPIEVTDPELMSTLNPWAGEFADWNDGLVQDPPNIDDTYRVSVYTDLREDAAARDLVYVFYYHPNYEGDQGVLYLPGEDEEWYQTNVSTIYAGRDGEWHPARQNLDAALRPLLQSHLDSAQSVPSGTLSSSTAAIVFTLVLALLAASAILGRPALARLRSV